MRALAVSMRMLLCEPVHSGIHVSPLSFSISGFALRRGQELTAPVSCPLTLAPVEHAHRTFFPVSSSGTETLAGHHETQRPQAHGSYPACHAWFEVPTKKGKNDFPGKPWKEWKPRNYSLFHWLRQRWLPTLLCASKITSTTAHLLRSCVYFSGLLGKEENDSWFLCCIIFLYFCQSIISWNRTLGPLHIFNFLFSNTRSSLCTACHEKTHMQHELETPAVPSLAPLPKNNIHCTADKEGS